MSDNKEVTLSDILAVLQLLHHATGKPHEVRIKHDGWATLNVEYSGDVVTTFSWEEPAKGKELGVRILEYITEMSKEQLSASLASLKQRQEDLLMEIEEIEATMKVLNKCEKP